MSLDVRPASQWRPMKLAENLQLQVAIFDPLTNAYSQQVRCFVHAFHQQSFAQTAAHLVHLNE